MTIKIPTLSEWWPFLEPLQFVLREHEESRFIRLYLNAEERTKLHLRWTDSETDDETGETVVVERGVFLAVIDGYEVVEFTITRDCTLIAGGEGELWCRTDDGMDYHLFAPTSDGFTVPYVRKERNHGQELMMFQAQQNMMRREQRLEATIERYELKMAEREAARRAEAKAGGKPATKPAGTDEATAGETSGGKQGKKKSPASPPKSEGGADGNETDTDE